MQGRSRPF